VLCTAASINKVVAQYYPRDAAGPAPVPAPAAPPKPAAKKPKPKVDRESLPQEEQLKRHGMFAVMGFNVAVILCVVFFVFFRGGLAALGTFDFLIIAFFGLLAAGAVFGIARWQNL